MDASSLAYEIWAKAEEETPDLAKKVQHMPDLVYSTRPALPSGDADGVACYVRSENGVDGFGLAEPGQDLQLLTAHQALSVFHAEIDTPTAPIRADHFDLTASLVRGPLAQTLCRAGTPSRCSPEGLEPSEREGWRHRPR